MLGTPKFLFFSSAVCNGFLEINESKTWQGIFTSQSSSQLTTSTLVKEQRRQKHEQQQPVLIF